MQEEASGLAASQEGGESTERETADKSLLDYQEVITLRSAESETEDVDVDGGTESNTKKECLTFHEDDETDIFLSQINVKEAEIPSSENLLKPSIEDVQKLARSLFGPTEAPTARSSPVKGNETETPERDMLGTPAKDDAAKQHSQESALLETPAKDDAAKKHLQDLIELHTNSEDILLKAWAHSNIAERKALNGIDRIRSYRQSCRKVVVDICNFNAAQTKHNEEAFREFREAVFGLERLLRQKSQDTTLKKIEKKYCTLKAEDMARIVSKTIEINQLIKEEKDFFETVTKSLKARIATNTVVLEKTLSATKY